jgi:hypothetical protein
MGRGCHALLVALVALLAGLTERSTLLPPTTPPRQRRPARRLGMADEAAGSTLALESVVVAMLLFVAMILVNQSGAPTQPTQPARVQMERNLQDLLQGLTEISDDEYGDRMTRMVVELLNGNSTATRNLLHRTVSDQALYSVTLHNSRGGSRLLWRDQEPTGEQVGRVVKWVPKPDTAFIVPEYGTYDGDTMGLGAQVIALRNGYPINDRDIPVEVRVTTNDTAVYRENVGVRFGEQQVTIGLVQGSATVHYYGTTGQNEFKLRVNASTALPAGTDLMVRVPARWLNVTGNTTDSNWTDVSWTRGEAYWTVQARLNTSATTVDFGFYGFRPVGDGATDFDLGSAELNNGTLARADLIWRGKTTTQSLAGPFTRSIAVSTPKTLVAGSAAPWNVLFMNAQNETTVRVLGTCITGCIRVTNITIVQPQGLPIFASVDGTWARSSDGTTLWWTGGTVELSQDEAHEFTLNVTSAQRTGGNAFSPLCPPSPSPRPPTLSASHRCLTTPLGPAARPRTSPTPPPPSRVTLSRTANMPSAPMLTSTAERAKLVAVSTWSTGPPG